MKKTTLLAAALLATACAETTTDPADAFRQALPRSEAVKVATYQSEAPATAAVPGGAAAKGDSDLLQSEYAVMSYYLALTVNSGVAWSLGLVQLIVAYPATTCVENVSCTWGPWVDDQGLNRWQLHVEKSGEGYLWALSGQPGSAPTAEFVPVLAGTAYPVDRTHGSGTFTIDFEAEAGLDHGGLWEQHDFGRIVIDYDNTSSVTVNALFTGARKDDEDQDPSNDHPMDAIYAFEDAASGGQLQVAFHDLQTTEQVSLRTRWSAGGAGRADAHYVGPDGAGGTANYFATECWAGHAQDFEEVYDSKYGIGTESLCSPFSQADYADVVLP